jgi:hypothetical protein
VTPAEYKRARELSAPLIPRITRRMRPRTFHAAINEIFDEDAEWGCLEVHFTESDGALRVLERLVYEALVREEREMLEREECELRRRFGG